MPVSSKEVIAIMNLVYILSSIWWCMAYIPNHVLYMQYLYYVHLVCLIWHNYYVTPFFLNWPVCLRTFFMSVCTDSLHSFGLLHPTVDMCPNLFTHSPMIRHVGHCVGAVAVLKWASFMCLFLNTNKCNSRVLYQLGFNSGKRKYSRFSTHKRI